MVAFELFVAPAIDLLSGAEVAGIAICRGSAGEALKEKSGLTHFLPARVEWRGRTPEVKALRWQGSGDITALSKRIVS